jgi:CheY-like chemotaxis protein
MSDNNTDTKESWLVGGGEMGKLLRAKDWSQSPLGSMDTWSPSLRTTVSLVLNSSFPISLAWGENHIQIYNDGYWPICGDKHPYSMGQDFKECWEPAFPVIGAAFYSALEGETSFLEDQRLFIDRIGYLEETFFTFSFSPIRDEAGKVAGLFHPVTETTNKMIGQRRTHLLRNLSVVANNARSVSEALTLAGSSLAEANLDLPFVLVYLIDETGTKGRLVAQSGIEVGTLASPTVIDWAASQSGWDFPAAIVHEKALLVENLRDIFPEIICEPYPESIKAGLILPLFTGQRDRPMAIMVMGASPRLPMNEVYQAFFDLLGSTMTAVISNAIAYETTEKRAEALAEIDRAKTAFFSNVSHEFRTPLTLMLSPLEDELAEKKYLPEPVYIDREMWEKIVLNLLSNALKHTFVGSIKVSLRWLDTYVALIVTDTGIGIPDSELPVLFDRFHRVKGAKSRSHEGTGIGLALIKELSALHGGEVSVESQEGEGSIFSVKIRTGHTHLSPDQIQGKSSPISSTFRGAAYLQEARSWVEPSASNQGMIPNKNSSDSAQTSVRKPRIVWADDNADLREYVASLLAPVYEVESVTDGEAALAAIHRELPSLVLSDVMMPKLDGFGLVKAMRENIETRNIPIILLSARAGQDSAIVGLDAGADDYLSKPFTAS